MRRHLLFQVVSAAVTLAGLGAALLLCSRIIQRESAELQRTSEAEARRIAARLQAGILTSVEPMERLGRWWLSQGKPSDPEDWRTDGQLFFAKSPALRQALWVGADGYQHWVARPGESPHVQRTHPDDLVRETVAAARDRHAMATSQVFDTPEHSTAFYVCFPLVTDKRTRGYVLGLYDAQALFASLTPSEVRSDHRITVFLAGRRVYATSPGNQSGARSAVASFDLAGQPWTVNLGVSLNYFGEFRGLIFIVGGVFGALIYSFSTLLYISQRHSLASQRAFAEVRDLNRDLNRKVADFQTLLDVSPVGIAVADDPECRTIRANPALAKMLGLPRDANISRSALDASKPSWHMMRDGREHQPEKLPMQVAAATGKEVLANEDQIVRADGTVIDVLSFAVPLLDEHGRVRGVLSAFVDISERKAQEEVRRELEQDLQRARRMKSLGAMAAGIAHHFNNLLTGIIGQASLAAERIPPESRAYEHITASLEASHKAAELVGRVLAYTGRAYQKLRPTDLGKFIADLQPQLAALAAPKVEIRLAIAPGLPPVLAAQDDLRQVFHHLVLNAVEAIVSDHSTVEIRADLHQVAGTERHLALPGEEFPPGAYVRIKVTDDGSGMPAEIAERAFDPFFSTKFLGRGLGLAEVLGIMRAHNGAVHLETAPEHGTSVTLLFPAAERSATRAA